eukprot:ctg_1837.g539
MAFVASLWTSRALSKQTQLAVGVGRSVLWGHRLRNDNSSGYSDRITSGGSCGRSQRQRSLHWPLSTLMAELITPQEAHRRKMSGECDVHLDVRTAEEHSKVRAPGSTLVPLMNSSAQGMQPNESFMEQVTQVTGGALDKKIIVSCASGKRSANAVERLRQAGYQHVADMQGGMTEYLKDQGLPVERP